MKLTRLKPFHDDYEPVQRYFHPNGWAIVKVRRDYDVVRGAVGNGPKEWWEVSPIFIAANLKRPVVSKKVVFCEDRLRECRVWCDENRNPRATGETP